MGITLIKLNCGSSDCFSTCSALCKYSQFLDVIRNYDCTLKLFGRLTAIISLVPWPPIKAGDYVLNKTEELQMVQSCAQKVKSGDGGDYLSRLLASTLGV